MPSSSITTLLLYFSLFDSQIFCFSYFSSLTYIHINWKYEFICLGRYLFGVSVWGACMGVSVLGICPEEEVSVQGGSLSRGDLCPGGISVQGISVRGVLPDRNSLTPMSTESQTRVKTLLCRNFVAGGNY